MVVPGRALTFSLFEYKHNVINETGNCVFSLRSADNNHGRVRGHVTLGELNLENLLGVVRREESSSTADVYGFKFLQVFKVLTLGNVDIRGFPWPYTSSYVCLKRSNPAGVLENPIQQMVVGEIPHHDDGSTKARLW
jgi:hypothetical protein